MTTRVSTGIAGLDQILLGGLLPGQVYLLRGKPGAGKTTLALQFLREGARRGEPALYVTLSESEAELRAGAASHGWDLAGVEILEIVPGDEELSPASDYSVFHPADVELAPATRKIIEVVQRLRPTRVAFDSLTAVRLLSRDPVRYRRQVLALKRFLSSRGATSLLIGESAFPDFDGEVASVVSGIIALEQVIGSDGMDRRGIRVEKHRGSAYETGEHAVRILPDGLEVYPRLMAPLEDPKAERGVIPSGTASLDDLLGGGLDRGLCTMIGGNSGVGKSSLGLAYLSAAAARGERGVVFSFDEWPTEVIYRSESIGLAVRGLVERGRLIIRKVNPLGLSPEQFCNWVRAEVEEEGARLIMVDTVNGYEMCTRDKFGFLSHLQQLVGFLKSRGVTTILVNEIAKLTGELTMAETGMSFLADNTVLIKSFEWDGALHKAIAITRRRLGAHDNRFHEYTVSDRGLRVGTPLTQVRGIMQGKAEVTERSGQAGWDE